MNEKSVQHEEETFVIICMLLAHYHLLRNNYDIISYYVFSLHYKWHGVL